MSVLKLNSILSVTQRGLSRSAVVSAYWNKHWKPGKFPKTEEEKKAAAAKYGLLREEYSVIPDNGNGAGDYPNFKPYSVESRDEFYPWDFPEYRRNFSEPLYHDFSIHTEDRYNVSAKRRFGLLYMACCFFGVMGFTFVMIFSAKNTMFIPALPPHLPQEGIKWYKYKKTETS